MRQTRKLLAILSSTLVIAGACEKGDHARDATESGGGAVGASFGTGPAAGSPRPGRPGSRTETYST
ncbi:MAG TPA: hypothetical protein VHM30_10455, partial [Gemmatimonadaceae bacterium]|nr:hypothetical protein [Gemmatimonadaceae bacterium]